MKNAKMFFVIACACSAMLGSDAGREDLPWYWTATPSGLDGGELVRFLYGIFHGYRSNLFYSMLCVRSVI